MTKITLIPGWLMKSIKLYDDSLNIRVGKLDKEAISADYVVGLSLGALAILKNIRRIKGRVILINPLLPKRSFSKWFINWKKYLAEEGLFFERQKFTKNPLKFIWETISCVKLLSIDFSKILDGVSKDRLTVIRGKNDNFFCDDKAVNFLNSKNVRVIEADGGHNWSSGIEKAMIDEIKKI